MTDVENIEIDAEMWFVANNNIAIRSSTGTYIYLLIWFAIIITHNFYAIAPGVTIFFTLAFTVMSLLRVGLIQNFERIYRKSPSIWKICFFPTIWGTALLWGILCYKGFTDPRFEPITQALVISTAGLSGGGVAALLADRVLTIGLFTAFLLPMEFAIFHPDFNDVSIILVFLLYWIGMFSITKIQHREYWLGLKNTFLIKKHALVLEQLNTLDGLTGLKNRKYFDESLRREMKNGIRAQSHLSLLLIDIDYFKMVNDNHGHLVGDECLRSLSVLLKEQVQRETDTVARYGGEEFAVILPLDDKKQALVLAEQIRKAVETLGFKSGEKEIPFTVSIGVATIVPQLGDLEESLIKMADKALYLAKDSGRNRVRGAGDC